MRPPFSIAEGSGPLVALAVHAGHDLRPEVADEICLDEATRLREEDPATDRLTAVAPTRMVAHRSRFEVDLNRSRERAVYRRPDDAWGLTVWSRELPESLIERSLAIHDEFYRRLGAHLDHLAAGGPFVVLDIHSYNHRRPGLDQPAAPTDNPEVNVGTGSVARERWGAMVERFIDTLSTQDVRAHPLDVRENVRFQGGHVSQWVNEHYAGRGCALALEFKKTYMDEWTGEIDDSHVDELRGALDATVGDLLDELSART